MVVVGEPARAVVVAVGRLRAVRRDQVVAAAAVRSENRDRRFSEALARERHPVRHASSVTGLGAGEQLGDRRQPRLGRARGSPDALELNGRLPSPAVVVEALVDRQLDAVRAERIGVPQREGPGDDGVANPELPGDTHEDDRGDLVVVDAVPHEVVVRERLDGDDLHGRVDRRDPIPLDAPDDCDPPAVDLREAERVADRDRDLVPELRRADGVADQQQVRHRRKPTHADATRS